MEKQGLIIIHSKDRGGGRTAAQALERCNRFAASHEDTQSVCGSLWSVSFTVCTAGRVER